MRFIPYKMCYDRLQIRFTRNILIIGLTLRSVEPHWILYQCKLQQIMYLTIEQIKQGNIKVPTFYCITLFFRTHRARKAVLKIRERQVRKSTLHTDRKSDASQRCKTGTLITVGWNIFPEFQVSIQFLFSDQFINQNLFHCSLCLYL